MNFIKKKNILFIINQKLLSHIILDNKNYLFNLFYLNNIFLKCKRKSKLNNKN